MIKRIYTKPNTSILNIELQYNPLCGSPVNWNDNPGHGGSHGNGNNNGNHYGWGKHNLYEEDELNQENSLW